MPTHWFVEISDFMNFTRFVCALREYPLRVYAHKYQNKNVLSSGLTLANSLLSFYVQTEKTGRYLSYSSKGGKEYCDIVSSTRAISKYAPIIYLDSFPSPFKTKSKKIQDKFKTIKVKDLGSLARLTYNPEFPDESNITLFTFPHKQKWVIGYISSFDLDNIVFCFNYVALKSNPNMSFLKYFGAEPKPPLFTNTFQHGYTYFPIIHLKKVHPIFGLK